jgi:pleiotropic regulator 1
MDVDSGLLEEPRGPPRLPPRRELPAWRLDRVISGHTGWIRALAPSPTNHFLASASTDRTIKLWDLATSRLLLTLTGHVAAVRGLACSDRHPYLFSAGEDRQVKCWDLTTNTVVRHYHGHLHGVYKVKVHPALDVVGTCSRDGTARLWDMRSKRCIHTLAGHKDTVHDLVMNDCGPQLITASADCTVRLWDIVAGRTITTLTHHKKGVRGLCLAPHEHTFASAGERIKRWQLPAGRFLHNLAQPPQEEADTARSTIWNCVSINADGVAAAGSDSGTVAFYDWPSGSLINSVGAAVQPGSLECEAGILCCSFDQTGTLLFTGDVDKSIKVYRESDLVGGE